MCDEGRYGGKGGKVGRTACRAAGRSRDAPPHLEESGHDSQVPRGGRKMGGARDGGRQGVVGEAGSGVWLWAGEGGVCLGLVVVEDGVQERAQDKALRAGAVLADEQAVVLD